MSDVKVTTAAMVAEDITSAFARMPKRDEGVHWLKAWEWDLLRAEVERLRSEQNPGLAVRQQAADALEQQVQTGQKKWTAWLETIQQKLSDLTGSRPVKTETLFSE